MNKPRVNYMLLSDVNENILNQDFPVDRYKKTKKRENRKLVFYVDANGVLKSPADSTFKLVISPTDVKLYSYSKTDKGRLIPLSRDKYGYKIFRLRSSSGKIQAGYLHALVARAMLGPKPKGDRYIFKDGDRKNVHPNNLEYRKDERVFR